MTNEKNQVKRVETENGDVLNLHKVRIGNVVVKIDCTDNTYKRVIWQDNFGGLWVNINEQWYRHVATFYGEPLFTNNFCCLKSVTAIEIS